MASLWFGLSIKPIGWTLSSPWDPIAGDYRAVDGWIRLHTNAPRHRAAALYVLNCTSERSIVAEAVKRWLAEALETAVVEAGGLRGGDAVGRGMGDSSTGAGGHCRAAYRRGEKRAPRSPAGGRLRRDLWPASKSWI
jgi:hypothetical protein